MRNGCFDRPTRGRGCEFGKQLQLLQAVGVSCKPRITRQGRRFQHSFLAWRAQPIRLARGCWCCCSSSSCGRSSGSSSVATACLAVVVFRPCKVFLVVLPCTLLTVRFANIQTMTKHSDAVIKPGVLFNRNLALIHCAQAVRALVDLMRPQVSKTLQRGRCCCGQDPRLLPDFPGRV